MHATAARDAGLQKDDRQNLSEQERLYLKAWDDMPPVERRRFHKLGLYPQLNWKARPTFGQEVHDPFATISDEKPDHRYFDEDKTYEESARTMAAEAVLKILYILTNSKHPGLRLSTDLLLAMINRTEVKSQAEMARKYNLTRAGISKRMRKMRQGSPLGGLEIYFFGGKKEASEKAKIRATRVHAERKQKSRCTTRKKRSL